MSLNIQTSTGLLEIGGSVTKEKVISALGYEPAKKEVETTVNGHTQNGNIHITVAEREIWNKDIEDLESHKSDKTAHITSKERDVWNNKSDFSGAYADLIDAPSITENDSGSMVIADESGNAIMKVDSNGLETTTVTAKSAVINGVDITTKLDEHKEEINGVSGNLTTHTSNTTAHITADERILWNSKSDFSGNYNDLIDAPDIKEDNSGEVVYADEAGNVIAKIGENGFETTQVIADNVIANGVNIGEVLSSHTGNGDIHITKEERKAWNEKADTSYVDTKVANLVNSAPEKLNTLDELAAALGDDENFATTVTNQIASKVDQTIFDSHTHTKAQIGLGNVDNTSDANKPVSTAQREALNELKSELSESIVSEAKEWTVADNSGNIIAKVNAAGLETTTVTAKAVIVDGADVKTTLDGLSELVGKKSVQTQISEAIAAENLSQYATDTDLATHTSNTTVHITSAERTAWNAKANQTDLDSHTSNKSNPHNVTKAQVGLGNVDNTSDANKPVSTAQQAALDSLKNELSESIVSESNQWTIVDENGNVIAKVDADGFETTAITAKSVVVNGTDIEPALDGKANSNHTHDQYLEASDIAGKVDKSYVDEQLATKVPNTRKINNKPLSADITLSASDVGALPNTTVIPSIDGLATEKYVTDKIAEAQLAEGEVDLSSYYTKSEADAKIEEAVGAIVHPVGGLATTAYVDEKVANKVSQTDFDAHTHTKAQVGLGNVDNTSDINKPVSTAQQTALDNLKSELSESIETALDGKAATSHIHPYGVCSSSASYTTKTVTVENFSLVEGARVIVKFTNANSASSPKLNVNSTGDIPIMQYGTTAVGSNAATSGWEAGAVLAFTYDGTNWVRDYWSNTTYTNIELGQGFGYCYTSSSVAEKEVTMSDYEAKTGGIVSVKFSYSVDGDMTMNINGKGAKTVNYMGSALIDDVIKGGDIATFIYTGSTYHLISVDRWFEDIAELQANDSRVKQMPTSANGNFRLLLTPSFQNEEATAYTYFNSNLYANPYYNTIYADIDGTATNVRDITAGNFLVGNGDGNMVEKTPAEVLTLIGGSKKTDYTASITTTWSGTAAPYSQSITVTGITASDNPVVDVTMSGTFATDQARLADWGKIYRIVTAANKITVYATAKTTVALPIQLQVVR